MASQELKYELVIPNLKHRGIVLKRHDVNIEVRKVKVLLMLRPFIPEILSSSRLSNLLRSGTKPSPVMGSTGYGLDAELTRKG